jgi:hypothetical protein
MYDYRTMKTSLLLIIPLMACSAIPAAATALTGSGAHMPLPPSGVSTGVGPVYVNLPGPFTGTFSAPASAGWLGSFTGTGTFPSSSAGAGTSTWDFTALAAGALPTSTIFDFGDLDGGSGGSEKFVLRAWDTSNQLITTSWLEQPFLISGSNPSDFILAAMPGWSLSGGAYTIDGTTVTGFNPNVGVFLLTNQAINTLEVQKFTTNYGFGIQAPAATPEPGSWILLGLGLAALAYRGRTLHAAKV